MVFKEKKTPSPAFERKKKIFEFIENNGVKDEFVNWLNTQHKEVGFSEKDSWEDIRFSILNESKVKEGELRNYASSLGKDHDLKNLLESIEEKTQKAEEVTRKAFFLSGFRKFSIAVGGIIFLLGLTFIGVAVALFLQIFKIGLPTHLRFYLASVVGLIGVIDLLGGSLLITR